MLLVERMKESYDLAKEFPFIFNHDRWTASCKVSGTGARPPEAWKIGLELAPSLTLSIEAAEYWRLRVCITVHMVDLRGY